MNLIEVLKESNGEQPKIARKEWEQGFYIHTQLYDELNKPESMYIRFEVEEFHDIVTDLRLTQDDVLADDWYCFGNNNYESN